MYALLDALYIACGVLCSTQVCVRLVGSSGVSLLVGAEEVMAIGQTLPAFLAAVRVIALFGALGWLRSRRVRALCADPSRAFASCCLVACACIVAAVSGAAWAYIGFECLFIGLWCPVMSDVVHRMRFRGAAWSRRALAASVLTATASMAFDERWLYAICAAGFAWRAVRAHTQVGDEEPRPEGSCGRVLPVPPLLWALGPLLVLTAASSEIVTVVTQSFDLAGFVGGSGLGSVVTVIGGLFLAALAAATIMLCWRCVVPRARIRMLVLTLAAAGLAVAVALYAGLSIALFEQVIVWIILLGSLDSIVRGDAIEPADPYTAIVMVLPCAAMLAGMLAMAMYAAPQRDVLSCLVAAVFLLGAGAYAMRRVASSDAPQIREQGDSCDGGGEAPSREVTDALADRWGLAPGEVQVLSRLYEGATLAQAAQERGVSKSTAASYAARAYAKLGVADKREALELLRESLEPAAKAAGERSFRRHVLTVGVGRLTALLLSILTCCCSYLGVMAASVYMVSFGADRVIRFAAEQLPVAAMLMAVASAASMPTLAHGPQPAGRDLSCRRRAAINLVTAIALAALLIVMMRGEQLPSGPYPNDPMIVLVLHTDTGVGLFCLLCLIALFARYARGVAEACVRLSAPLAVAHVVACLLALCALVAAWVLATPMDALCALAFVSGGIASSVSQSLAPQDGLSGAAGSQAAREGRLGLRMPVSFDVGALRLVALVCFGVYVGGVMTAFLWYPSAAVVSPVSLVVLCAVAAASCALVRWKGHALPSCACSDFRACLVALVAFSSVVLVVRAGSGIDIICALVPMCLTGAYGLTRVTELAATTGVPVGRMLVPLALPVLMGIACSRFAMLLVNMVSQMVGLTLWPVCALACPIGCAGVLVCLRSLRLRCDLARDGAASWAAVLTDAGLTPAEGEVALAYAAGLSVPRVAQIRCVGESTVKTQLRAVYRKLGVHTRDDLAAALIRLAEAYSETL